MDNLLKSGKAQQRRDSFQQSPLANASGMSRSAYYESENRNYVTPSIRSYSAHGPESMRSQSVLSLNTYYQQHRDSQLQNMGSTAAESPDRLTHLKRRYTTGKERTVSGNGYPEIPGMYREHGSELSASALARLENGLPSPLVLDLPAHRTYSPQLFEPRPVAINESETTGPALSSNSQIKEGITPITESDLTPRAISASATRYNGSLGTAPVPKSNSSSSFDPFAHEFARRASPGVNGYSVVSPVGPSSNTTQPSAAVDTKRSRTSSVSASLPSPRSATFSLFSAGDSSQTTNASTSISSPNPSPQRHSPTSHLPPIGTKPKAVPSHDHLWTATATDNSKSNNSSGYPAPSPLDMGFPKQSPTSLGNFWGKSLPASQTSVPPSSGVWTTGKGLGMTVNGSSCDVWG